MKRSLQAKLILSYLGVAMLTVLVVSALIWLTSGNSFMNLIMEQQTALLKETVQAYYTANGTLDGFFSYYMQTGQIPPALDHPDDSDRPPAKREPRAVRGMVDSEYRALMPTFNFDVGQKVPENIIRDAIAVDVYGETVAWILPDTSFQFKLSAEERYYQQRTSVAIGLAALAGILVAVVTGILLSGRLVKPIRRLTHASQALARGDLKQRLPVSSQDELGQLTATFNQMSADLVQADEQRKRLTADISHDLSTPLQIISGYIEMLEEGEVSLTPQRLEIIKTEIEYLRRLVGDLGMLTLVEGGGMEIHVRSLQPEALLERVYNAYLPIARRQGVALILDVPESPPLIHADEGRMLQVLKNLVDNALRYTSEGGSITLSLAVGERIQMRVSDSGSGIEAEDLPRVFNRFYRSDKARGRNSGNTGLGLAICKALVTAQGGQISAESEGRNRGTSMVITI